MEVVIMAVAVVAVMKVVGVVLTEAVVVMMWRHWW